MNRQQRREAKKNGLQVDKPRNNFPVAPITVESLIAKYPDIKTSLDRMLTQARADGIAEGGIKASGEIYNLIWASVIIALHDRHDFTAEKLNQLVSDAVNHIDCVQAKFVTIEDLIGLVSDFGVVVDGFDFNKVTRSASQTHDRLRVYFERVEDMSKMEQAFKLFDDGVMDAKTVAEQTGSTIGSVYTYKRMWNQEKMSDMPIDEFTEQLFNSPVVAQDKTERIEVDRVEEICTKKRRINTSENKTIPKREEEAVVENKVVETQKKVLEVPVKGRKFEVKRHNRYYSRVWFI